MCWVTGLLRHVVDLPGNIILTLPPGLGNAHELLVLLRHPVDRIRHGSDVSYHLLNGRGGLDDARRLIFYQTIQIPHALNAILQNYLHFLQCLVLLYNLLVHVGNVGRNLLGGAGGLLCRTGQILRNLRNCFAGFLYILHDVLLCSNKGVYLLAHGSNLVLTLNIDSVGQVRKTVTTIQICKGFDGGIDRLEYQLGQQQNDEECNDKQQNNCFTNHIF